MAFEPLPIDEHLGDIVRRLRERRAIVITAAPGAGKTTRVPPALVADGPVILLQPRRVAARAIARRIAAERGWTIGREVGWQVRFERQFSKETQLLVATEGVLTARLQQDPTLDDFRTVVIDEFHERSVHADLGLALAKQAWIARDDLRLVVMSATLDARQVAAFLDDCPIVEVPGRTFPLEISYRPGIAIEEAVIDAHAQSHDGALLAFLPGAPEIRRALDRLAPQLAGKGVDVLPLHGSLDAEEQDAALRPSGRPRVILATNLAETTLTVPDVVTVVDTGLHKAARYDPERAIDSLETERISRDSADQRAGRAGRVRAGAAIRLWDARDRLRPHREPEIARVDLMSVVLDLCAWGAKPRSFEWFEPPPTSAIDAAVTLLRRFDAIDAGYRLTAVGRTLVRLPLHPRLGRILLAAHGAPEAARACAWLAERHVMPPRHGATSCDLLATVDREQALPPHVVRVAREIAEAYRRARGAEPIARISEQAFRQAVLAGYPDRVARRRAPTGDRLVLASGSGAKLARESGVHDAEFLVAVDVTAGASGPGAEALVRVATRVEREWLQTTSKEIRHEMTDAGVRAWHVDRYDDLILSEHPVPVDPEAAAALVAEAYIKRGPTDEDRELIDRLRFAGAAEDDTFAALVRHASTGARRLDDVRLADHLPPEIAARLDRDAPRFLALPAGRRVRLEYRGDGRVVAAVKLQHVFGLRSTPRLGRSKTPVTFELLAPNGRPAQVTNDLESFWATGYAIVRRELRARYPKHAWPERP
ncbi:MAG TPA: ATP-dependent helicase C-terminal domain-containing protein [Vicinamibacterales bacterium]|nr:ATP-dependent helicase C-terminal domain-containing protein [Vicinamibacterales bacterium]